MEGGQTTTTLMKMSGRRLGPCTGGPRQGFDLSSDFSRERLPSLIPTPSAASSSSTTTTFPVPVPSGFTTLFAGPWPNVKRGYLILRHARVRYTCTA